MSSKKPPTKRRRPKPHNGVTHKKNQPLKGDPGLFALKNRLEKEQGK